MRNYASTPILQIPMYPVVPTCDVCKITPRFTLDHFDMISEIHVDMCIDDSEGRWTWPCVRCQAEFSHDEVTVTRLSMVMRHDALLDFLGGIDRLIEIDMTELLISEADALMAETNAGSNPSRHSMWNTGDMQAVIGEARVAEYWQRSHTSASARLRDSENALRVLERNDQICVALHFMKIGGEA